MFNFWNDVYTPLSDTHLVSSNCHPKSSKSNHVDTGITMETASTVAATTSSGSKGPAGSTTLRRTTELRPVLGSCSRVKRTWRMWIAPCPYCSIYLYYTYYIYIWYIYIYVYLICISDIYIYVSINIYLYIYIWLYNIYIYTYLLGQWWMWLFVDWLMLGWSTDRFWSSIRGWSESITVALVKNGFWQSRISRVVKKQPAN